MHIEEILCSSSYMHLKGLEGKKEERNPHQNYVPYEGGKNAIYPSKNLSSQHETMSYLASHPRQQIEDQCKRNIKSQVR